LMIVIALTALRWLQPPAHESAPSEQQVREWR
jgi:hypothetical protein